MSCFSNPENEQTTNGLKHSLVGKTRNDELSKATCYTKSLKLVTDNHHCGYLLAVYRTDKTML